MPGSFPKRRNMHYEILGEPVFRERDVPRMLELAVARPDGRAGEADDLQAYQARTAAARRRRVTAVSRDADPRKASASP